jgi:hypothetical protein
MANRAKAKGTSFETAVVDWLREQGFAAARRIVLHGNKDQGDVDTGVGWNLECKNCRTMTLGPWVVEADVETVNAGHPVIVVAKRIGKSDPGEAYVIMPLRVFTEAVLRPSQSAQSGQSGTLSE